jgi:hypothetical protein
VLVTVRGSYRDVFTDRNGFFELRDLEAGEITLEIAAWSLPDEVVDPPPDTEAIELLPGQAGECEPFVLRLRTTPVLQRFRPM